jgi:spore coat protein U-like protein
MQLSQSRLQGFLAVGLVLAALSPQVLAGSTGPATMNVSLTVAQSCTLGITDLAFGSTSVSGNPTAQGEVNLKCRISATPVTVLLSKNTGTMKVNPGDASGVAYSLYKPTSICGKATVDDNTPAGSYADTVQVTVSW